MSIEQSIRRILDLQPHYQAATTPEMKERGRVLRRELMPEVRILAPDISARLGRFGNDLIVEASDGVTRKTELPWVRFASKRMSPNPREGYYTVVHFSTSGSAVHVTVGCGSSKYVGGFFTELPDHELDRKTEWMRAVVVKAEGTLEPFTDPAEFGARRRLPKSFERATAMSKRLNYADVEDVLVRQLLFQAAERLRLIYEAQDLGMDLSHADETQNAIDREIRPQANVGQGYGLSALEKRLVEERAMKVAAEWLAGKGFKTTNTSANKPFDFLAIKGENALKVEVKGTTSERTDAVLMTRNEVELHLREAGKTALIIVSKISLIRDSDETRAEGGELEALMGWEIEDWSLEPTAYRVTRA